MTEKNAHLGAGILRKLLSEVGTLLRWRFLRDAVAASVFKTPTVNGLQASQANSLAPDRAPGEMINGLR